MPPKRKGNNQWRKPSATGKKVKVAKTATKDVSATKPSTPAKLIQTSNSEKHVDKEEPKRLSMIWGVHFQAIDIVRGSRSQNDIRYSEVTRNHQCTANAAVALAYDRLIPFSAWSTAIVDNILDYGDQLYLKSISSRMSDNSSPDLFVIEVFPHFIIQNVTYSLDINEMEGVTGYVGEGFQIQGGLGVSLAEGLPQIFCNFRSAIFTCGLLSICLCKTSNAHYYLFDSHSRGVDGRGIEVGGKACLLRFLDISQLYGFLMQNYGRGQLYTLVPVEVQIGSVNNPNEDRQYLLMNVYGALSTCVVPFEGLSKELVRASEEPEQASEYQDDDSETLASTTVVREGAIIQQQEVPAHYLGAMDNECPYCGALFFRSENKTCCNRGAVSLPADSAYPEFLKALITDMHPRSRGYMKSIRRYNTLLSLGSTRFDEKKKLAKGAPVVVISGQIYHSVGDVVPSNPAFGALYFVDSGEASRRRAENVVSVGCDTTLLGQIDALLRDTHPYARIYSTLGQVVQDARRTGGTNAIPRLGLYFHYEPGTDRKIHAAPSTSDEIGAVFRSFDGDIPPPGQIRVHLIADNPNKSDPAHRRFQIRDIPRTSSIADALCYPLLFPNGELGWSIGLPKTRGKKNIGRREFECYRLMSRANRFNPIVLCGRLTQQFIVDKYIQIEGDRLTYLRNHQAKLRAESYAGLQDYVARRAGAGPVAGEKVGRVVILPSSFTGGMRYMQQNYQDAMAIVAKFGRPSLFVTFTCNPHWPEITENMGGRLLNAQDRPLLIARIFDLKRREFFEDVLKFKIFGEVIAFVYVIEFQKRGLPHMHCLLTLADGDKPRNPEDVDRMISAELPAENTRLFQTIMSSMIHGPCGVRDPTSSCMINEECSKSFPKSFTESTTIDGHRAVYRRRNDGRTASLKRNRTLYMVDNRDVVPYSPYLCTKYNSHINVEVVTSVGAVKYAFKYINKGPDAAVFQVVDEEYYDEIKAFIESRYISSGEAAWRLLTFKISGKSHSVKRLPIHLPGERVLHFEEGEEEAAIRSTKVSLLEAYFQLNVHDISARQYKYCEIPLTYVFNSTDNRWCRRQRKRSVIPRMYTISPKYVEKFHLRILLLHVAGPTSFEDLRMFNGVTYPTFREAVRARDLIASDLTWIRTMEHAALVDMPGCMRKLFAYLLCFCEVGDPLSLWTSFKPYMYEDYRKKGISESNSEDRALHRIESTLRFLGKSLRDFGLPEPSNDPTVIGDIDEDDQSVAPDFTALNPALLNPEQRSAFDRVIGALESKGMIDGYFYLQGSGGTGKTHLYNAILEYCEQRRIPNVAVAFTGIAALLLRNGRTVHSTFRLPLNLDANSRSSITAQSEEAAHLRSLRLIIWDEVSMASYHVIDAVDGLLRDVCSDPRPFGGKCVLLGGDVKQLLPVAPGRVRQVELFFSNCQAWSRFQVHRLSTNMRAIIGGDDFISWLEQLGRGAINEKLAVGSKGSVEGDFVCLPQRCLTNDVVDEIYGQLDLLTTQQLAERAILCPRNDHCNQLNDRILGQFPGSLTIVLSNDSVASGDEDEIANFPEEYLNSITPSGMPLHQLKIKVGVPVILLRNLSLADGLINGTRLLVLAVTDMLLTAQIVTGRFFGRTVLIPKMDLTSSDNDGPFKLKRRQFPVKVCFALTMNKAQGQTFERVGIFLANPVFAHGQLYVAFSRARSWDAVKVQVVTARNQGKLLRSTDKIYTKNIVYGNILNLIEK